MPQSMNEGFSPAHQALLFGLLARKVILGVGEERGARVLRQAVWRYGAQRGQRMALRAKANGHELDYVSFLAYSEWRAPSDAFEQKTLETTPHLHQQVFRCPWNDTWRETGLLPYGRHYCRHIDRAVLYGFDSGLFIKVESTLSNGGDCCDFLYWDAELEGENARRLERLRRELGDSAVMPWEYHTGHVLATVGNVLVQSLGRGGGAMVDAALSEFTAQVGQAAAIVVVTHSAGDFDRLPTRG